MSIKEEVLGSLSFYEVILWGNYPSELTLCTYRPKEAVQDLFKDMKASGVDKCEVWGINSTELEGDGSEDYFPIFCVELHMEYKSIDELVEDIVVWRLSGLMDKEMEGM